MQYSLTVLTPYYNREKYIEILKASLNAQTRKDFQWLIIDDGSEKNVKDEFLSGLDFFAEYHRKDNGGKHTALNFAHDFIKSDYTVILDSDDTLTPDAVEAICEYIDKYKEREDVGILSFYRGFNGVSHTDYGDETVSDYNTFRINGERPGDCCEVIKTEVLKKYPFPVFKGEKFVSEAHLWVNSAYKYKTAYIPKIVYNCEYVEDGLTFQGRRLYKNNPKGSMYMQSLFINRHFKLKIRLKRILLYCYYFLVSVKKDVLK